MSIYKEFLTNDHLRLLKDFLGEVIFKVYGPTFTVENSTIVSPSFSIPVRKSWINFSNTRLETKNEVDYYKLDLQKADEPTGIEYDRKMNSLEGGSRFVFNRGSGGQHCMKIEIYNKIQTWNEEQLMYDSAIVFYFQSGVRFCISIVEDITDQLECSIENAYIENITSQCHLRETLI